MITTNRVDWDRFKNLPGADDENFETLCRALIRLHYGRFGIFRATAQMPGIEFQLNLHSDCALGKAGTQFGWQCKWYGIESGKSIGKTRRNQIEEAIRLSEEKYPDLTDWVLWTKRPLTGGKKGDDEWYHKIDSKFRLHARDSSDIEDLLSGDAAMLRATYFGDCILRPETLAERHEHSVSSVHTRWLPQAHQEVDAERVLRRMLGEAISWKRMTEVADKLEKSARSMLRGEAPPSQLAADNLAFITKLNELAKTLRAAPTRLEEGNFDLIQDFFEQRPESLSASLSILPRRLRSLRLPSNFHATNGLAFYGAGQSLINEMQQSLNTRIYAVMADAGGGKTQLSATLTAPQENRPAGILLHGRDLKHGGSLDDLAGTFVIDGTPMTSFEALVAALDAASQRAKRRLPIVIDGLNEAEDPRDWKKPLSEANTLLNKYPGVLLVVTLRTGTKHPSNDQWRNPEQELERTVFARIALPEETPLVEMEGFGINTQEAIKRYFKHFRINAPVNAVPADLLAHPLTLRIFCEVTNPPPQKCEVGPEALPRSLVQLFEKYLARAVERIGELSPRSIPYNGHDVRRALNQLALMLWDQNSREVDQAYYREQIGDNKRVWEHSLVKLMEQEGLILRIVDDTSGQYGIIPVYDAIGGYVVADALLSKMGYSDFAAWIKKPEVVSRFHNEKWDELHPMATDIFSALVALTPRRFKQEQLWNLAPETLKRLALLEAMKLEGDLIDRATVDEIIKLIRDPSLSSTIFGHLFHTRSIPKHPFNATFLDDQLRGMSNTERELRWTELTRNDYERSYSYKNIPQVGKEWQKDRSLRSEADMLIARWRMWLLTSTVRETRMKMTRALYWFGRGAPSSLFKLTIESLSISDPYIPERMLAAAYGVVMECHGLNRDATYETTALKRFAQELYSEMFSQGAKCRTTHILIREYAHRIIEVAQEANSTLFTADEMKRVQPPFPQDLHRAWPKIILKKEVYFPDNPLGVDFKNYTLGRLVPERGNYNFQHAEYQQVVAEVLGRIHKLGWSAEAFSKIDERISTTSFRRQQHDTSNKRIDRYGKKFSLIAYYEQLGMRMDLGLIEPSTSGNSGRSSDVDIDPSFPEPPCELLIDSSNWLSGRHHTLAAWIQRGPIPDTKPLRHQDTINGEKGPWLMLDGYFNQQDKISGRDIFFFVRAFLADEKDYRKIVGALKGQSMHDRWLPEKPAEIYAFAGEFPWCSTYGKYAEQTLSFVTERKFVTVKRPRTVFEESYNAEDARKYFELLRKGEDVPKDLMNSLSTSVKTVIEPQQEVREKTIDYKITPPVCDFRWEGQTIDDKNVSGTLLAKHIAQDLKLRWIPGSHDVADTQGKRATYNTAHDAHARENCQKAFFIREDLLLDYLRRKKQVLIWVSWGERGMADHLFDHFQNNREEYGQSSQVFHEVETLRPRAKRKAKKK